MAAFRSSPSSRRPYSWTSARLRNDVSMTSLLSLLGALLVAIGASVQALRWLLTEGGVMRSRRALAATRTEHRELRRAVKRAQTDWTAWTLVAAGAWFVTIAELTAALG